MATKTFFSFHYKPDNWRASQVRNFGAIDGNQPVSDNDWESITKQGEQAIKNWIHNQMSGRAAAVVLIGSGTAGRKWINYEIIHAWDKGKGVVGIYIHNLLDAAKQKSTKGNNPFDHITLGGTSNKLSSVVKAYDPPYSDSKQAYDYIGKNIGGWVDEAIRIRNSR
jgi:Thoeris protein ThsB, TIR-like domain